VTRNAGYPCAARRSSCRRRGTVRMEWSATPVSGWPRVRAIPRAGDWRRR
jgi:hypothetical protein